MKVKLEVLYTMQEDKNNKQYIQLINYTLIDVDPGNNLCIL